MSCRVPDPFDEEDEAQLAHAVALSLQDMGGGKTDPIMVSSSSDEEGDGLDRPLEANPEAFGAGKITGTRRSGSPNTDSGLASLPGPVTGLRGLDRKKMEEERLARVKRRRTQDSDMESQGRMPRLKPSTSQWSESAAVPHQNASRTRQATSGTRTPARAFTSSDAATYQLPYPKGVVKRTWVKGCDRTGNDIKIEEVLQKEQLKLAVLSSYQWDEDWLMSKIDLAKTKLLLLAYAPDDATKAQMVANVPSNSIRFCFPPMNGPGSMHSKLQLLKYATYMRIVVATGNLMPFDWGETGTLENAVFLIDIPKLSKVALGATIPDHPQFARDLFYFLRASGLDEKLISTLEDGYDFSETARYGFVHSIAGSHTTDESWQRTGYCGLGRTVKSLGLDTHGPVSIDMVSASLGMIKLDLLTCIYNAAQGDSGLTEYEIRTASKTKQIAGTRSAKPYQSSRRASLGEKFRIYFPSEETVARSIGGKRCWKAKDRYCFLGVKKEGFGLKQLDGGELTSKRRTPGARHNVEAAGTITIQRKWWESPAFPRALARDCKNSGRPGVLIHSKMMFVCPPSHQPDEETWRDKAGISCGSSNATPRRAGRTGDGDGDTAMAVPWAYVGSANLSESAWGRLTKDPKTKKPRLSCRNWECGVVVPVWADARASNDRPAPQNKKKPGSGSLEPQQNTDGTLSIMKIFDGVVPVPFEVPAEPLDDSKPLRGPWFFGEV